ncbi:hypothetical protein ACLB1R_29420 [Escherichia coli]
MVAAVLNDEALKASWLAEVEEMRLAASGNASGTGEGIEHRDARTQFRLSA